VDHLRAGSFDEQVITVSLQDVLTYFKAPSVIDYLSLDVEGAEEAVLSNFAFHSYQFRVITVERPSEKLRKILQNNEYAYICDNGSYGDELWVHKQQRSTLPADLAKPCRPNSVSRCQCALALSFTLRKSCPPIPTNA